MFSLVLTLVNNKIITTTIQPNVIVKLIFPFTKLFIDNVQRLIGRTSEFTNNFFIEIKNSEIHNPILKQNTTPPNKNPISLVTIWLDHSPNPHAVESSKELFSVY